MKKTFALIITTVLLFIGNISMADDTIPGYSPTRGEDSCYTLVETDGAGDVTLYEVGADKSLTEKHYNVQLKQTTFGSGDSSYTKDINLFGKTVTITGKYDESKILEPIVNNTDPSGQPVNGVYVENSTYTLIYNNASTYGQSAILGDVNVDFYGNTSTLIRNYTTDAYHDSGC